MPGTRVRGPGDNQWKISGGRSMTGLPNRPGGILIDGSDSAGAAGRLSVSEGGWNQGCAIR